MNDNITIIEKKISEVRKFTVYGNPELLGLLNGEKHLHVNAAFRCIPKEHKQMLFFMIFIKILKLALMFCIF